MAFRLINIGLNRTEIIGLVISFITIILDIIFLYGTDLFYFILGLCFIIAGFPFFVFLIIETNTVREKDEMFLEFSRNLVENVRAGTPISKSIVNVQSKDYGALNPHVQKLSNQISLGIPVKIAFETFARDIGSVTILRAINILSESQKAGGEVEDVLESVITSVSQIERLKKDRQNAIYGLVVQGYIIFFIFIIIMVVMEFKILPIATGIIPDSGSSEGFEGIAGIGGFGSGKIASAEELARPFLWLLIIQAFFTGLIIGKLSEGSIRSGFKHFFVLTVLAVMVNTGLKVFLQ
ncbi:MAG: type II secretion system F family protein [Nanoarchaeota archaeon]